MALKKTRTNSGHAAGPSGGRWMTRDMAKTSARKRRRIEGKRLCRETRQDH